MATITPNVGGIPYPVAPAPYEQVLLDTRVTDTDTIPFREFTTLTQADCKLTLVGGTAVVFTTGTNIVTIGVNVPPLAATIIRGTVRGVK